MATDAAGPAPDAGVVYRAAVVRSGVPGADPATGLWIRDGRIVAVGQADDLMRADGGAATQVSLGDATILPGFVDAHCHVSMLAYLLAGADCSPEAAPDVASILDRLARTPPAADGWVTGSGYAEYQLHDLRHPTRAELDEAVPGVPCVLYHRSMHTCVVNSAGLAALGFDDDSPDPPRGMLGRGPDGRLDGRLLESVMFDLMSANMRRLVEALDGPGRGALVRRVGEHLAARGVTTAADAAADAGAFLAFREAERRGDLPIRVTAMFTYPEATWLLRAGMTTGYGSERLRIGAIKLFADGGLSSRTAAVEQPYDTPPHDTGMLWYEPEALAAVVRECAEAGFSVGVHAQGERAIRSTLDAFGAVTPPGNPLRHRIEHGGLFRADLREHAARLRIHVVSQPAFLSAIGDGYYEAIGPARAAYLYPYRSLIDAGILVAGSSDAPVIDASPLVALRDAVLRRTDGGVTIGAGETVSIAEAVAMYTRNAAYVEWSEGRIGTLEPGALADFVALDRDPLSVPAPDVADAAVLLTVVGGEVVHDGRTAAVA